MTARVAQMAQVAHPAAPRESTGASHSRTAPKSSSSSSGGRRRRRLRCPPLGRTSLLSSPPLTFRCGRREHVPLLLSCHDISSRANRPA